MITKTLPCCDLLNYLGGPVDSKGKPREEPPAVIRGSHELAAASLNAVAPFPLHNPDRRRWFYPKACRHLMHNFAETRAEVEHLILPIVRGTEDVLLAGLRRDALAFVTFYHPSRSIPIRTLS